MSIDDIREQKPVYSDERCFAWRIPGADRYLVEASDDQGTVKATYTVDRDGDPVVPSIQDVPEEDFAKALESYDWNPLREAVHRNWLEAECERLASCDGETIWKLTREPGRYILDKAGDILDEVSGVRAIQWYELYNDLEEFEGDRTPLLEVRIADSDALLDDFNDFSCEEARRLCEKYSAYDGDDDPPEWAEYTVPDNVWVDLQNPLLGNTETIRLRPGYSEYSNGDITAAFEEVVDHEAAEEEFKKHLKRIAKKEA